MGGLDVPCSRGFYVGINRRADPFATGRGPKRLGTIVLLPKASSCGRAGKAGLACNSSSERRLVSQCRALRCSDWAGQRVHRSTLPRQSQWIISRLYRSCCHKSPIISLRTTISGHDGKGCEPNPELAVRSFCPRGQDGGPGRCGIEAARLVAAEFLGRQRP